MASPALSKQFDMLIASPSTDVTTPLAPLPAETTKTVPQKSPVLTCQKKPRQQQHSFQERRAQSDKKNEALERQLHQTKLQTQTIVSKTNLLKNTVEAYVEDADDESSEVYEEEETDSDTDNEDSDDDEEEDANKIEDIGDESSGEERRRQRKLERRKQREEEELEEELKDPSKARKRPRPHHPQLETPKEIELLVKSMNQEALDRVIEQEASLKEQYAALKEQRDLLTQKHDAILRFRELVEHHQQEYIEHAQWCQSVEVTIEQQLNRLEQKELELEKREQEVEVKWLAVKKYEETHLFVVDNEKERKCLDQLNKALATRKDELDTLQKKCDERNTSLEQRAKELDTKYTEIARLEKEFEEKKQQTASINALLPSNTATNITAAASSSRSTPTTTATTTTTTLNSHHPPHQHHHHHSGNNVLVKPEAALDAIIQEMQRTNTNQITQAEMQQTMPVALQQNLAFCAIKHKLRSFSQSTGNHQILLVKDQETDRVLIMQCIAKSVLNPSSK